MAEPAGNQLEIGGLGRALTVAGNLNAYAAIPGTGPAGETCRSCRFSYKHRNGARNYWKCGLIRMTHSAETDIRLKTPACHRWKTKRRSHEK